jgi:hypothetical protein
LTTMSLGEISRDKGYEGNGSHLGLIRRGNVDEDVSRLHRDFRVCKALAHVAAFKGVTYAAS